MGKEEFKEYLSKQSVAKDKVDWAQQKKLWLQHLEGLYKEIEAWMGSVASNKAISITREKKLMREELVGEYSADQLIIKVAGRQIIVDPMGHQVIAAAGRVDIKGPAGTAMLVLVPRSAERPRTEVMTFSSKKEMEEYDKKRAAQPPPPPEEHVWKIVSRSPHVTFLSLTENSFFDLVLSVLGNG